MSSSIDDRAQSELLIRARDAARNAYAPYSGFPVGAAVLTEDGAIYAGANVENASYGLGVCAERSAISAAVSAGHREILAVAVAAPRKLYTTPCGACRQTLNEFRPQRGDMAVILDDGDRGEVVWLNELLPRSFGPHHLEDSSVAESTEVGDRKETHAG